MQKKEVFFKTDFAVTEQCESGYSMRFRFRYFTSKLRRDYVASFDGEKYENCRLNDDGSLTVTFDDHRLGIGDLMVERHYYLDDERFRTGQCDMVVSAKPVLQFDKEAAEGERISQVVLTPDGAEDFECQSVVEPYWMYGGFGEAAYRNEEERKKNEQERQAAEVTRSNEWTTWFEAVVAAWAAWLSGVKGDWSLWFKQISDAWTAWFDGRKREWSAWFKAVSDYWAEWLADTKNDWTSWFNGIKKDWTDWFTGVKLDYDQWFSATKQAWAEWFDATKLDIGDWFLQTKQSWIDWFSATKQDWNKWFAASKQDWSGWFASVKESWSVWFGTSSTTGIQGLWNTFNRAAIEAEQARAKAEGERASAETARVNAEKTRSTQEAERVAAESKRASAETARANAEKTRQEQEAARQAQVAACKEATDLAEELNSHPQMQGDNGNWWKWNSETDEYEDTGIIARGGAMYPRFLMRRNHVLMYDDTSAFKNRVVRRRNHAIIKF